MRDAFTRNGDGTSTFTTTGNLGFRFAADGKLSSVTDQGGNAITVTYDGSGRIATATAPGSTTLTFTYNGAGRLGGVTGPATSSPPPTRRAACASTPTAITASCP